jgi:hypothetical protein
MRAGPTGQRQAEVTPRTRDTKGDGEHVVRTKLRYIGQVSSKALNSMPNCLYTRATRKKQNGDVRSLESFSYDCAVIIEPRRKL